MLSHFRRGHHQEFDGGHMSTRTINGHGEHWKTTDRANSSLLNNNILPDAYPPRSNSSAFNPDLSRALRVDAYLLAIIRTEDKRNTFYSSEVVSKLRQKEQTQSFINKPCSLFITDRYLIIFDRGSQVIAETIPLENVDPTCVHSETPDTLNDIFMYRLLDRNFPTTTTSQVSSSNSNDSSPVVVFKCSNKESKVLVDTIRHPHGRPIKNPRSARSETRSTVSRRMNDVEGMTSYEPQQLAHDPTLMNNPTYVVGPQHTRTINHQQSSTATADHYKRLTEDLNKCFDDIELFVRHIESLTEYTKEFEREHRRKDKKSSGGLKQMVDKLPDDRFFIDIFQKFKYSFNLLGELKPIIHSPNAPELVHYLLSPLQFISQILRTKHSTQLQIAQDINTPALTKEARELLLNCLTSKEQDIFRTLGPAWLRSADETSQKFGDYRPIFFEGRPVWFQEATNDHPSQSVRSIDERQQTSWTSPRQSNQNNNNNGSAFTRQPSPAARFDSSTIDRSAKNGVGETYNSNMQNEHAWAIERRRLGAKICVVKLDRRGQNPKELTVRRDELVEIEDMSRKWWRAKNFHGETGHVPNNIVEEIEIEQRSTPKMSPSNTSAFIPRSSSAPNRGFNNVNGRRQHNADDHKQYLLRSPSHGNNFIMQSTNSTTTNPAIMRDQLFQQTYSPSVSSPPPPPSTIPPPPPPPPMPFQLLTSPSSPWSTLQIPESSRQGRSRSNTNLSTPRVDELQLELNQRITDRVGLLNEHSTRDEVQRWLASKHVSPGLAHNLRGINGDELFQLSKHSLDQFTNEAESARVYMLLSQQKQLAGYRSGDMSERSPRLNNSAIGSLKASTINDADDNFSLRLDDSASRSLKIKLKQRRDKIEQSESVNRIVL